MSDWSVVPFMMACRDVSGGNVKIPASDFSASGRLPIIDQGGRPIAGFTDDVACAVKTPPPLIVFGDHTRRFKFVDRPFAMGADGVKLLQPRPGFDARYLFHYLSSVSLASAGYSRHFKFLRAISVPKPPLEEQRRIADLLDRAHVLRAKRGETIARLDELIESAFESRFGAANWEGPYRPLDELVDPSRPITYGILKPGANVASGKQYVQVLDIQDQSIQVAQLRRTSEEIERAFPRSRLIPGDVVMSIRGHVGRAAIVPESLTHANVSRDVVRVAVGDDGSFVIGALHSIAGQRWLLKHSKGVAVRGVNIGDLRRFPVPRASPRLMVDFADHYRRVRALRERSAAHLAYLDELFASLQQRAFRGDLFSSPLPPELVDAVA